MLKHLLKVIAFKLKADLDAGGMRKINLILQRSIYWVKAE